MKTKTFDGHGPSRLVAMLVLGAVMLLAGCGGLPSAPAGFQVESATSSTLQPQFTSAHLHYVLAVH